MMQRDMLSLEPGVAANRVQPAKPQFAVVQETRRQFDDVPSQEAEPCCSILSAQHPPAQSWQLLP
ncbi:MAG: hypothetical protein ACKPJJ_11865 [Planctomycetaceae bacterium]